MNIKYISYSLFLTSTIFAGCAGSPVHTSSMNRYQLMEIDDYTLCKAAAPREAYSPSAAVFLEVRRRGIDCQKIYVYTPTQPKQAPVQIIIQQNPPTHFPNLNACIQDGGPIFCPNYPRR